MKKPDIEAHIEIDKEECLNDTINFVYGVKVKNIE